MKPKSSQPQASARGEELTLRIERALVTPEYFTKAVHAFVELLTNVTEDTSKRGKKPEWNMAVGEDGSALVVRAVPDIETRETAREVVKRVKDGVTKIENGDFNSDDLPEGALFAVQELASLPGLTIGNGSGKGLRVTSKSADFLKGALGVQKSSIGSIEGRLSTISDRDAFQFVVYDTLSDHGVNCFVPDEMFPEALAAFGRRVSVFGTIQYDKEGRAISIRVETMRVLKDLSELPPIAYFKGILRTA